MAKRVKYLSQVVAHLEKKYGAEKAQAIMDKALLRYEQIVEDNKDEPREYHMHTRQRIYPSIAVFDAMLSEGVDRSEAADFVVGYYKWRASGLAPKIRAIFKIPGLYKVVPKFFFNMTQKSFGPQMGFASTDKYLSKTEMRFNMVACPYQEKCVQYGCPEIVRGFCDADDICYGNMHPKISWDRTKTLGHGYDVCDFKVRIKR
ncbi:MAG: L-2-amino-thiazoline-4-carboxylic acid hydrolase [Eggerthellaceae bacterium]|nr:L-2-amino-thiazoline-4-carboxylic acid hydrolase [Eggerthellaceae bacterium]